MLFAPLVLAATLATLPRPEADAAEEPAEPDFALVINRALASAKGEEARRLGGLRRRAGAWPRHAQLRLEVLARSVALERDELEARCAELAAEPGDGRAGDWTPPLRLDPETLARAASARLELAPDEAVLLHQRLHELLAQLRFKDDAVRELEAVVALAREAAEAAEAESPREAVEAVELLYERRQALVAVRVERELLLAQLARLTGLALTRSGPAARCGGAEL